MLLPPAGVERGEGGLQIDRPDRLTGLPEGPQQIDQGGTTIHLGRAALDEQVKAAKQKGGPGESLDSAKGGFSFPSQG